MARIGDTVRAALGYWWNLVTDAAQAGFTVTETVSLANEIANGFGQKLSFAENSAISQLYGYSRRIINAGNELQSATPDQGITADMVSIPPYARDDQEMDTYPLFHVKFEYQYLDSAGNEQTTIKTSVFTDLLPDTVGDLALAVQDDAEAMASKYGHTLISATPQQILSV